MWAAAARANRAFVSTLRHDDEDWRLRIDKALIESTAMSFGMDQVIWPEKRYIRHLRVTDKQLGLPAGFRKQHFPLPAFSAEDVSEDAA